MSETGSKQTKRTRTSKYAGLTVRRKYVEAVLAGDVDELVKAFHWGATPEGVEYWCKLAAKSRKMHAGDVMRLRAMLRHGDVRG